ncbi:MAG TPA: hypothetical protein VNA16_06610 [Abditibacteriaceae bacterium]|nr:hypothetical protein [Abditibacteriaceae bacterium]
MGGAAGKSGAFDSISNGPAAGEKAVTSARESRALRDTEKDEQTANVRYVEGKAFFLRNGVWADGAYDPAKSPKLVRIKFASAQYFALAKDITIAKWLSIGERVILVLKDKTVQIEP